MVTLKDKKDINTDNRYDMTPVTSSGQAMKFAEAVLEDNLSI